jgi:hypothetical protein
MRSQDVETMLVGSIKEILKNKTYFYYSSVGPGYCYLTEDGHRVIIEAVNMLGARMISALEQEDIERSKQLMLDELKKGN